MGACSTCWHAWQGLAWAILSPITQLFLFLSLHTVYSDNVTPPPSSSKTRVGQGKLSYHTHKSNIYCLHCDHASAHTLIIRVVLSWMFCKYRMRRLVSTDICCQCLLLTTVQRLGKLDGTLQPLNSGLLSDPSPSVCVCVCVWWRELCWLCCDLGWHCSQSSVIELPSSCHKLHDTSLPLDWISWRKT